MHGVLGWMDPFSYAEFGVIYAEHRESLNTEVLSKSHWIQAQLLFSQDILNDPFY